MTERLAARGQAWFIVLAFAVLAAPFASAQHQHGAGSGFVIAHEAHLDGDSFVGDLQTFDILALGSDLVPDVHQDLHVRALLDGVTLYETTPASGHDYDGVHSFTIRWPAAGPYEVQVLEGDKVVAAFTGTVRALTDAPAAKAVLSAPTFAVVGTPARFEFFASFDGNTPIPHTDSIFEVLQGDRLVFRVHTHTHEEAQRLVYDFPAAGTYTVRSISYVAYPRPTGKAFDTVTAEATVDVLDAPTPALPQLAAAPAAAPANPVITGDAAGPYTLLGTYDPYDVVGTGTLQHLSAIVMDPATGAPLQHVDFEATLLGPGGTTVFHSATLHEYDGILQLTAMRPTVGDYVLQVDASYDDWRGHVDIPYQVGLPQGASLGATLTGTIPDAKVGQPLALSFQASDMLGRPDAHTELEFALDDEAGVPLLQAKVHTHDDGVFPLTIGFAQPGKATLRLTPFALEPRFGPLDAAGGVHYDIPVAAGDFPAPAPSVNDDQESPAPAALILVGLLALVLWRRS